MNIKNLSVFALAITFSLPVFAGAPDQNLNFKSSTVTVNADTVNVNANTVNVLPSKETTDLYAQYKHPWWVNAGAGLTTGFSSDDSVNPGFNISFNIQPTTHQLLTLRSAGADFIGGDYYDVGLLYGFISRNRNGYVSLAAGAAGVFFDKSFRTDQNTNPSTVGIPMEFQAFWTPVPNFGLGMIGYANANDQHSFYGMVLAIQLANLVPI